jgi:uncharacterized membrane protein
VIALLTQDELREDPRDLIANYLLAAAQRLSLASEHFAALYLLSHGVIKILLVVGLLSRKLWVDPIAVVVFAAFIVYQLYRYSFTHAIGLIALSLFSS